MDYPPKRNEMASKDTSRGTKDLVLYVAIAIILVIVVWIFSIHQARTGGSPNLPLKWIGFAGMTAIVFGYAIRTCRRLWGNQRFWLLLSLFLAVHSGVGVFVLATVSAVPLVFYAVLTGLEYVLLTAYLGFFLRSVK